jgi:hypothetical protein
MLIVKPTDATMSPTQNYTDNPPSYDTATEDAGMFQDNTSLYIQANSYPASTSGAPHKPDLKAPVPPQQLALAGPSYTPQPAGGSAPTVYYYLNPLTQEHVASFLPPDAPAMICLQTGEHITHTNYGILGTYFPLNST